MEAYDVSKRSNIPITLSKTALQSSDETHQETASMYCTSALNPGSGAFLTPGSRVRDGQKIKIRHPG